LNDPLLPYQHFLGMTTMAQVEGHRRGPSRSQRDGDADHLALFGMDDRDAAVLRHAYSFDSEVRARDASPEIAEFKYDPRRSKGLRRLR